MVLNKKILRTIKVDKSRYIGLLLLVTFSCLAFTAFQLISPSALGSLDNFWQEANVEDAHFALQEPLEDEVALARDFNLQLEAIRHYENVLADSTVRVFQESEKINRYGVVSGRELQAQGEILIDRLHANANNIAIGSEILVAGKPFQVVGYMAKPDYIYTLKAPSDLIFSPGGFGMGVISKADFASLPNFQTIYSVVFGQDNRNEVKSALNERNTVLSWLDREDNPRISAVEPDLRAKETLGNFLPTFMLVVTCLIIAVVLWRMLKNEFVQIGTLYALGYKKFDIFRHYLVYPLALSMIGGTLGTLLGSRLVLPMIMVTDGMQYNLPVIEVIYIPTILIVSLALPYLFLVPATWYVIQKALRMSPQELMRGAGNKATVSRLEKSLNLTRLNFNTKFRMRELVRNIPRAITLIVGITFASSLLMIGFVMNDSIRDIVEVGYEDLYKHDYQYGFQGLQFADPQGAERQAVLPIGVLSEGDEIIVTAFGVEPDGMLLNLTDTQGNRISEKVSVSLTLADALALQPGESITVLSKVSDLKTEIVIDEIANTYLGLSLYMPLDQFNDTFEMPEGSYSILLSDRALNIDPELLASSATKEELQESFKVLVALLQGLLIGMGVISVIIGVIIIYILTSLLIEENRYNISLMKVLGYGKKQIFTLVLNTNLVLVLLGYAISIPLTWYLSDILFAEVTEEMSMSIPAKISYQNMLLGLGIMLSSYWLSNLVSRRKVWAISMADSLKNREE